MTINSKKNARPLSPHLQVYRITLTMAMSIMHRITGIALFFGTIFLLWWLAAIAYGGELYIQMQYCASSTIGQIFLFGYSWALIHHMLGGIRHFIWDVGRGFNLCKVELMAKITIIGSITINILIWFISYLVKGVI